MKPSEALEKHRDEIRRIIADYPVTNPRIFGSVARGEDTEDSDLDIVVKIAGPMSYFDLFRMEDQLSDLLGVPTEVHTDGEFRERMRARIERDASPL